MDHFQPAKPARFDRLTTAISESLHRPFCQGLLQSNLPVAFDNCIFIPEWQLGLTRKLMHPVMFINGLYLIPNRYLLAIHSPVVAGHTMQWLDFSTRRGWQEKPVFAEKNRRLRSRQSLRVWPDKPARNRPIICIATILPGFPPTRFDHRIVFQKNRDSPT